MTTQKREIDAVTGVETTGHEWDGIKELNKPLPQMVAVDLLRHHRVGHRLLDRLSGLADALRLHQGHARLQPARDGRRRGQGGARARRPQYRDKLAAHAARPDQERPGPAALRHGRRRGGLPDQLRALPRPRRPGLRRLSQPQRRRMAVGRQRSRTSTRPSASASARIRRTRAPRRCRATASTSCSTTPRSTTLPSTSCRCPASRPIRRQLAEARRSSPSSAPPATARTARASRSRAHPTSPTAIWLYGGSKAAIVESIRTGRGGMMPAWAGRLDPVTLKALAVYVHSLGGGQ